MAAIIYKAKDTLITQNTVTINSGADVIFKAGKAVILKPGFSVAVGSIFNGKIDPTLQQQTIDSEIKYAYDSQGNRVKKSYSDLNSEKYYVRDAAGNTIAVYDENGSQQYVNLFGADVFGKYSRNEGSYYYYIKDHLGSTRTVVNSSGDVAEAYEYYPFGKIARSYVTGNGTDEKFTGKELDNDNDERLFYFGARYYDGDLGRWLAVDPLANKYPGWSPYNYTLNNPTLFVDPNGMNVDSNSASVKDLKETKAELDENKNQLSQAWDEGDVLGVLGGLAKTVWSRTKLAYKEATFIPVPMPTALALTPGIAVPSGINSGKSFFEGTKYSNKVLKQMQTGDYHSFPESVTAFEKNGLVTTIKGGDGVTRQMLKIPGEYKNSKGFFEFLKESDGTINHRLFNPTTGK